MSPQEEQEWFEKFIEDISKNPELEFGARAILALRSSPLPMPEQRAQRVLEKINAEMNK